MSEKRLRVLLVDDHAMVREGLHMLLEVHPDLEVVGDAKNGQEAIEMAREHRPDVVLMDVTMPGMGGIEATKAIVAMGINTKVLGLTVHENQEYFFHMLAAGASGYVLKGETSEELVDAIRAVAQGGVHLTPVLAGRMVGEYLRIRNQAVNAGDDGLTAREVEVLRLIAQGKTNQEVADSLHLSVYTVQTHRAHIMAKLRMENRHQLMMYAVRKGYVEAHT